jgi:hypothetical protein
MWNQTIAVKCKLKIWKEAVVAEIRYPNICMEEFKETTNNCKSEMSPLGVIGKQCYELGGSHTDAVRMCQQLLGHVHARRVLRHHIHLNFCSQPSRKWKQKILR